MTRRELAFGLPVSLRGADLFDPAAAGELPRYVFFHLRTTTNAKPDQYPPEALRELPRTVGSPGNARLRLGASITFNILEQAPEELIEPVGGLLRASLAADVPVFLCLDGQNWWQKRPDLWNWWDPKVRGYDPANRENVEWYGWSKEQAVKIGWRNWGRLIRVAPAPNIFAPRFLAEHDRAYRSLLPVIVEWLHSLPAERKHLFGGLKVGWEASINVNAFYYPGGNSIYEKNPSDASFDPKPRDKNAGWTFGQPPIGYAAVSTAGIRKSGELGKEDIEAVVHRYLERYCKIAFEAGIPKHMIFTHQGGTYAPWEKHLSFKPAMNGYSAPGWSFYSHDPPDCGPLAAEMESAKRRQWGAVEWLRRGPDARAWKRSLDRTLGFRQCRLISIYNWHNLQNVTAALEAVRLLLEGAPPEREEKG